ncbi:basic helix-loop-helix domain-containing protein USF3 [Lates japonicus]|uniref:Basic helix-loop-helix domain-containing protein USF3 n=1 Tax=Lates japonicus TaxID=270547 RepID=A0AAD3NID4_LATJO|nr:basic helix-loop-helix domain-containing protein USF3 [Lates japonicus]
MPSSDHAGAAGSTQRATASGVTAFWAPNQAALPLRIHQLACCLLLCLLQYNMSHKISTTNSSACRFFTECWKQLVHILTPCSAQVNHLHTGHPGISLHGSSTHNYHCEWPGVCLAARRPLTKREFPGWPSTLQLVQPTTSEEQLTNVALNSLGASAVSARASLRAFHHAFLARAMTTDRGQFCSCAETGHASTTVFYVCGSVCTSSITATAPSRPITSSSRALLPEFITATNFSVAPGCSTAPSASRDAGLLCRTGQPGRRWATLEQRCFNKPYYSPWEPQKPTVSASRGAPAGLAGWVAKPHGQWQLKLLSGVIRGQVGEGLSSPAGHEQASQNITYSQLSRFSGQSQSSSQVAVASLSVNNPQSRPSSTQQPYLALPVWLANRGSVPSPVGTSGHMSQASTAALSPCSGAAS